MIILHTKDTDIRYAYLNLYPDQFVPEEVKKTDSWIKPTMDYFANVAYAQFTKNSETFSHNYRLVKGIIDRRDFFEQPHEVQSFTDALVTDLGLPSKIVHYPILNPPLNTLVGELSKRPDNTFVRAFDDESKSQELEAKTDILMQFIIQTGRQTVLSQLATEGEDVPDDKQLNQMTMEHVEEYMTDYTSLAEQWSNHVLKAMKMEFVMKEKSEDAFRDLLISGRQFYLLYEDNSKLGFNVKVVNPKNEWHLTVPDRKYTSDPTSRGGCYAGGEVEVMELSEIIETFDLTKEEIDHLKNGIKQFNLLNVRESNLVNTRNVGINSVTYDTYDPLVLQERLLAEAALKENNDQLKDWLGLSNNVTAYGNKYAVVRAYWISKKKVGMLTFTDEQGVEQTIRVDENYVEGSIPTEISIVWGWINQWYQGTKIGPDIYQVKPFTLLPYCPLIGLIHEIKNTQTRSLIDLMKNFQTIYNVCMNQIFQLLEKEIGNVYLTSIRQVPTPKDGDGQDALQVFEETARKSGMLYVDDSPENLKAPSNFNQNRSVDLTRTTEIESRFRIATQMKQECWQLVGVSEQRVGEVAATETATGTQAALSQSFAQTEPYFAAHSYVLNMLYQAILDAAQHIESTKPMSTIKYVSSEGENGFIQVNGDEIKDRDLKVFITDRAEDLRNLQEIRALSQDMIQNGASAYEIIKFYNTSSMRKMEQIAKKLKDQMDGYKQNEQQQQQQQIEQQGQQAQALLEQQEQQHQEDRADNDYNKEMDRINKKEVALINQFGKGNDPLAPTSLDGQPEVLEASRLTLDQQGMAQDHEMHIREFQQRQREHSDKMSVESRKLQAERERTQADLQGKRMEIQKAKIAKAATAAKAKKPAKKK